MLELLVSAVNRKIVPLALGWVPVPRLSRGQISIALFVVGLCVYGAVAGSRLGKQSSDPHFVYQAHAWLSGRLHTEPMPRGADDPARVETVRLIDGSEVRGRRLRSRRTFRKTDGAEIPVQSIAESIGTTEYVSFPPTPALLMVPQVLIAGKSANDVAFTVAMAALVLPLCFMLLGALRVRGESERGIGEDLWLTFALGFGTVLFFSAVQGRVWFTAHVVGVVFALLYVRFSLGAAHPIASGVALGLAALTRTPMAFMFPLFFLELWRMTRAEPSAERTGLFFKRAAQFSAPVVAMALFAMWHNAARFDQLTEFGHSYLAVRQQAQIEAHGLFSWHYLSRNLAVLLTLLPDFGGERAWVQISGHGLAIWVTTPILLLLLWPKRSTSLARSICITVAFVAVPTLLYQNSGWVQFGYRFALDYMVLLFALLAVGGRPWKWWCKLLIVIAIAVNLFGAMTFNSSHEYYRTDGRAYSTVISN